jgi:hypothetical protein
VTPLPYKSTLNITTTPGNFTFFGLSMTLGSVAHIRIVDTSGIRDGLSVVVTAPGCPQVGSLLLAVPSANNTIYIASFVSNTTALYVVTVTSYNSTKFAITASYGDALSTTRTLQTGIPCWGVNEHIGGVVYFNTSVPAGAQVYVNTTGYQNTYVRQGAQPLLTDQYLLANLGGR